MKPGFKPEFRITHAVTTALTAIERAQGFIEAATLSEEWIQQMGARALILEAHHTTRIEGILLRAWPPRCRRSGIGGKRSFAKTY